jgi:hypothetical protein
LGPDGEGRPGILGLTCLPSLSSLDPTQKTTGRLGEQARVGCLARRISQGKA